MAKVALAAKKPAKKVAAKATKKIAKKAVTPKKVAKKAITPKKSAKKSLVKVSFKSTLSTNVFSFTSPISFIHYDNKLT